MKSRKERKYIYTGNEEKPGRARNEEVPKRYSGVVGYTAGRQISPKRASAGVSFT